MRYSFMTICYDGAEIKYSPLMENDGKKCVQVWVERWNEERAEFDSMYIVLPKGRMRDAVGYSRKEIRYFEKMLNKISDIILEEAR